MELSKKEKTIKYLVYCLVILAAGLLQNVSGLWPQINGARCFFLIPVCVLLGINEDEKNSALLGFFAGIVWDMVSVQHMGFNCILLMLSCYLTSAFVVFVFRNTFIIGIAEASVVIVLYCFVYWFLFVLLKSSDGAGIALAGFYLPSALYTIALTPVLYLIIIPLKDKLNKTEQLDR